MNNKSYKVKKQIFNILVTIVFFSVLISLLILGIVQKDKKFSDTENRNLASFPQISLSAVLDGRFMTEFENYLSDQFFVRNSIVSLKTQISRILGNSEVNGVYIGKNGRLYEVQSLFDDDSVSETVSKINSFSQSNDIENQFMMLVPNATQILKDDFPMLLETADQTEFINIIYSELDSSIECLDAVTPLNNYENKSELYFYTDHHWTSQAAFCVFKYFAEEKDFDFEENKYEINTVSNTFQGTLSSSSGIYDNYDDISVVFPISSIGKFYINNFDTKEKYVSCFNSEKLKTTNQYEVFFGGNFSRIQIVTDNLNGKNLLVIKDSYANCFVPLLIPYFESIVMIDPRYFTDDIENVLEMTDFTHLLYLYNVNTFLEDTSIIDMLEN